MGWWSEDIMGGDGPCDIQCMFDREFGKEINADEYEYELPKSIAGTKILEFGKKCVEDFFYFEEVHQAIGFILIDNGMPMTNDVRKAVLAATDSEIEEGAGSWSSPEGRLAKLREFRKIVEDYPREGAAISMPHQTGLFEKLAEHLSK